MMGLCYLQEVLKKIEKLDIDKREEKYQRIRPEGVHIEGVCTLTSHCGCLNVEDKGERPDVEVATALNWDIKTTFLFRLE